MILGPTLPGWLWREAQRFAVQDLVVSCPSLRHDRVLVVCCPFLPAQSSEMQAEGKKIAPPNLQLGGATAKNPKLLLSYPASTTTINTSPDPDLRYFPHPDYPVNCLICFRACPPPQNRAPLFLQNVHKPKARLEEKPPILEAF